MIEALHEDMERYNDLYDEGQERFEAALSSLDRSYDYHNSILYGLEYLDNLPDALAQVIKTHRPQLVEICESVLDSVDTSLCKHICPQRYAPDLNSSDKG